MTKNERTTPRVSRRDTLKVCLVPAGIVAARWLTACSPDAESAEPPDLEAGSNAKPALDASTPGNPSSSPVVTSDAAVATDANASAPSTDATLGSGGDAGQAAPQDASGALADATASDASVGTGAWASGGTKSMQGGYPDPFTMGTMGAACALYPAQTLGPCYARMPPTREDISDGILGLPMRLSFLVVRADGCTPVPNASVDIWHSGTDGVYSAFRTGTVCNPGSMDVLSETFCRGVQSTNASGRVDFNTVFPGWYTGRTLHIHFTVRVDGREYVTSQLYFEDALTDEILAQGEYKARGRRNTTNSGDSIFRSGGATPQQVIFSTAKRADGALHAWKVLSVRGA